MRVEQLRSVSPSQGMSQYGSPPSDLENKKADYAETITVAGF